MNRWLIEERHAKPETPRLKRNIREFASPKENALIARKNTGPSGRSRNIAQTIAAREPMRSAR
jgi:hypothetical protein